MKRDKRLFHQWKEASDTDKHLVAEFDFPGGYENAMLANLCGDGKEEVIVYDGRRAQIYANGGCDLEAGMPAQPQNRRLTNWSLYTGWEDKDYTFFKPGQTPTLETPEQSNDFSIHQGPIDRCQNIYPIR